MFSCFLLLEIATQGLAHIPVDWWVCHIFPGEMMFQLFHPVGCCVSCYIFCTLLPTKSVQHTSVYDKIVTIKKLSLPSNARI